MLSKYVLNRCAQKVSEVQAEHKYEREVVLVGNDLLDSGIAVWCRKALCYVHTHNCDHLSSHTVN